MNTSSRTHSKFIQSGLLLFVLLLGIEFIGCASSEESGKQFTTPTAADTAMQMVKSLKAENVSLQQQIDKLQRDNRSATAHIAELETQLNELRENPSAIPTQTPTPPSVTIKPADAYSPEYERGLSFFMSRNFKDAISSFQSALGTGMIEGREDNCHYWIGECYFGMKSYKPAIEQFQKVLTYKNSDKGDDAQVMIANSYLSMGNKKSAKEEFKKLIERYPGSPYVKSAKAKMGKL